MNNTYDLLFSDLEGTKMYYDFLRKHIKGKSVLEFASGTGDLLNLLNQEYDVLGVDIDEAMLKKAVDKYPDLENKMQVGSFMDYKEDAIYDSLICVGDSLNYMQSIENLNAFVETATKLSNHIIVDFHHLYRLKEFEEPYFEEGSTESFDYAYQIEVYEDNLIHTINYLNGQIEQVYQWVFKPEDLIQLFEAKGYTADVYTDFDQEGILEEGEKVMIIFSKVKI